MKETDIEKDCADLAEMIGWVAYKGSGRVGAPDKIFLKQGRGFTCEMKVPGKSQSQAQIDEQEILESKGIDYYLIDNLQDMRAALLEQESKFE